MTKIQLTAKAAWNGMLVMTMGGILSRFIQIHPEFVSSGGSKTGLFVGLCVLLLVFFGLLTHFRIPLHLTGTASIHIEPDSFVYFAKIQRLFYLFAGLCLGVGFLQGGERMAMLVVKLPLSFQSWISRWVSGDIWGVFEMSFVGLQAVFYPVGYLLLCVYLLLGADRLVRWQITLLKRFAVKEYAHE